MTLTLLAALCLPLGLLVGAVGAACLSRGAFKRGPEVFPAKLRTIAGDAPGLKATWSWASVQARWVHDVLLVHQACSAQPRLPVANMTGLVRRVGSGAPQRLGPKPAALTITLDNGVLVEPPARRRRSPRGPSRCWSRPDPNLTVRPIWMMPRRRARATMARVAMWATAEEEQLCSATTIPCSACSGR